MEFDGCVVMPCVGLGWGDVMGLFLFFYDVNEIENVGDREVPPMLRQDDTSNSSDLVKIEDQPRACHDLRRPRSARLPSPSMMKLEGSGTADVGLSRRAWVWPARSYPVAAI